MICLILFNFYTILWVLVAKMDQTFYLKTAGKFCLAHGLRQLIRDVKRDVRTLNFTGDVTYAAPGKTPNVGSEKVVMRRKMLKK